jgi:DNA-3-methyladenine glycosylase I
LSETISADLKKRGFKFVGPVIVYAWMQAVGMVDDHALDCFRRGANKR